MDTPSVMSEPLWTVTVKASGALLRAVILEDNSAAENVAGNVYLTHGDPGLFAMCTGLVMGSLPTELVIEGVTVVRDGPDGSKVMNIDAVPFFVRFIARFVAAVNKQDLDIAWAHWLTIPDDDTRDQVIAYLGSFAAYRLLEMGAHGYFG